MKEKILIALRNKFKTLGLSEKVLDTLANIVVAKTTDEANIETEVAGVEDIAKAFQSEADRVRTEAAQKAKADADKSKNPEKKEEPEKKENPEVPEWAKSLIDSNKALADKLSAIEAGKTTQTRKTTLEAKLTGVSDTFKKVALKNFERMQFDSDEDFDSFLSEFDTEIAEAQQEFSNTSLQTGSHIPSFLTSKNKDGISKETEAYIQSQQKADSTVPQGKQVFQQPSSS